MKILNDIVKRYFKDKLVTFTPTHHFNEIGFLMIIKVIFLGGHAKYELLPVDRCLNILKPERRYTLSKI